MSSAGDSQGGGGHRNLKTQNTKCCDIDGRKSGLVLERAECLPSADDIIRAHERAAKQKKADEDAMAAERGVERQDPIEAGWDDDLGKPEDTPAIDYLGE